MEMVIEVADILSFEAVVGKRRLPKSRRHIIPGELRLYAPRVEEGIADWKLEELEKADNPECCSDIEEAATIVFGCFLTFILSGGQWRGSWPRFSNVRHRQELAERCIDRVRWKLNEILRNEFTPAIVAGYRHSARNRTPPSVEFKNDFDTLLGLKEFVREVSVEIRRQSRLTASFNRTCVNK